MASGLAILIRMHQAGSPGIRSNMARRGAVWESLIGTLQQMSKRSATPNPTFIRCHLAASRWILIIMSAVHRPSPTRLVIADDWPRTRQALRALLAAHTGFEVIGEAAVGNEAVARVERLHPDVVLLDVRMPRLGGVAATEQIKTRWPSVRVVVHSMAVECREEALAAGADAFVPKGAPVDDLLGALRPDAPAR